MANNDHLNVLKQGVDEWSQWRRRYPKTKPDLSAAQLNGANLCKVNLCGANLQGVNLGGANLFGANLCKSDLFGANLEQANLSRAVLSGANLFGANLWGATLCKANLTEANLYGVNLRWANVSQACLTGVSFKRATLEGALFVAAHCPEVDLKDADLTYADLEAACQGKVIAFTEVRLFQKTISQNALHELRVAIQVFMEACGFEFKDQVETANDETFQLSKFWSGHACTLTELHNNYETGRWALQKAFLDLPGQNITNELFDAATGLIASLAHFDRGVVRLGELIVTKMTRQGRSHVDTEILSPALAHELVVNPDLLRDSDGLEGFTKNSQSQANFTC